MTRLPLAILAWAVGLSVALCLGLMGCSVRPIHCTGSEDCPAVERCEAGRCTETVKR